MSRLIDADALIELIQKDIEKTASFMNTAEKYDGSFEKLYGQLNTLRNYKSIISDLPTTYDVEKVVAELEKEILGKPIHQEFCNGIYRAIKIVRKGGAE